MSLPTCPACHTPIDQDVLPGEFDCPQCGACLQPRKSYFRALFVIAVCLAVLSLWVAGIERRYLFLGTVISALPAFLLLAAINARIFPVELDLARKRFDTGRSLWAVLRTVAWILVAITLYLLLEPAIMRLAQ